MRDYGKVFCSFWSSEDMRGLSEDARILALYLLSCPHGTIAGVFRLPDLYACEDLQWTAERVCKGFAELFANGFANRCETTKWVFLPKHFEWNKPENPNQWKAARKIAEQVPARCSWVAEFKRVFAEACGDPLPPPANPSETVPQPLPNQKQYQEQKQEQEQQLLSPETQEDDRLARWMFDLITQAVPGTKQPKFDKWANTVRLMRERDSLTHRQIAEVFLWANRDTFWKTNILSPDKLREKFPQLQAKSQEALHGIRNQPARQTATDRINTALDEAFGDGGTGIILEADFDRLDAHEAADCRSGSVPSVV